MSLIRVSSLHLRKARRTDGAAIYKLRNEKQIRNNSFSSQKIRWKSHQRWLLDKLSVNNCLFLIAEIWKEEKKEFIGFIRFDIVGKKAIVSLGIVKKMRGKGWGKIIFKKALEKIKKYFNHVDKIRAFVIKDNHQSINFFEALKFIRLKSVKINDKNALEYGIQI